MVIAFWSIVLLVLVAGIVWTRLRRRRVIAAVEASSLVPDASLTAGRSRSSATIESSAHMGAAQHGAVGGFAGPTN